MANTCLQFAFAMANAVLKFAYAMAYTKLKHSGLFFFWGGCDSDYTDDNYER